MVMPIIPFEKTLADGAGTEGGRRCAWHGHWIGGESPSRGEVIATASRRQLHAVFAVVRRRRWRREAVWGRSPRRTAAPNASEPLGKPDRPGERVSERDAQNPTEAGAVMGAGAAGHPVLLPREVCMGPLGSCRSGLGSRSDLVLVRRLLAVGEVVSDLALHHVASCVVRRGRALEGFGGRAAK